MSLLVPAVGDRLVSVRRGITGVVSHRAEVFVTRTTRASVFAAYSPGGPEARYVAKGGRWVLTPRYLDYIDTLEEDR